MWGRERKAREQRAQQYLIAHPEDASAVAVALETLRRNPKASAKDLAENYAAHGLPEEHWTSIAWRWERIWQALVAPEK